jgi:hypothetical protein
MQKVATDRVGPDLGSLDPTSRRRIRVFAVKLLLVTPVSVALATQLGYPLFGTVSYLCLWHSFFCGVVGLFRRDRHGAAVLTAWDEMAAFLAIAILTHWLGAMLA